MLEYGKRLGISDCSSESKKKELGASSRGKVLGKGAGSVRGNASRMFNRGERT